MRPFFLALVMAGLAAPAAALADDATGSTAPSMRQHEAAFAQVHQQMKTLHQQERAQFLAALSPAHKALLEQVAGQLAISPNPDYQGAARRLNSALSPGESSAILRAHAAFKQQARSIMESAMAQFERSLPPDEAQQMEQHKAQMEQRPHTERQVDAGSLLLGIGDHHMMMMGGPGHPPM